MVKSSVCGTGIDIFLCVCVQVAFSGGTRTWLHQLCADSCCYMAGRGAGHPMSVTCPPLIPGLDVRDTRQSQLQDKGLDGEYEL